MKKKARASFASYYDEETHEIITDLNELVNILVNDFGKISGTLSHNKCIEIHLLAKAFLELTELYQQLVGGNQNEN